MKKAVLYCRVANAESLSASDALHSQQSQLMAYAEKKGFEIAGTYMDAGLSGRTLDRPGLQAVMQAIKDGDADTILVANRSRLFRGPLPEELRRLPVHALKERSLGLER